MTAPSGYRAPLPEYAHPPLVAATLGVVHAEDQSLESEPSLAKIQHALGPEWGVPWREVNPNAWPNSDSKARGWQVENLLADRQIRISGGHFSFTWRANEVGRYPRYENLRDGFVSAWDLWNRQERPRPISAKSWFVSYLNQFPQGTVWQTPADWSFLRMFSNQLGPFDDRLPEVFDSRWSYQVPEFPGHLELSATLRGVCSGSPTLWLRLSASCLETTLDTASILDGMDAGRRAIVQTFSDLMSPSANAYWGLRRREK